MWLVDTGCGYDLVPKREVALLRRFVNKAKHTITVHTENGPIVTDDVDNISVKELDEHLTPCMLNNAASVLAVGY